MSKIDELDMEEELDQKRLQTVRAMHTIFASSQIVLKTKLARLKAEDLSRDYNELRDILLETIECIPEYEAVIRGFLAIAADKFSKANNNAREGLDMCVNICGDLRKPNLGRID
jgi:hypothetical protein